MIRKENDAFILETKDTTYCFRIMPSGHLEHVYYGRTINLSYGLDALSQKTAFNGATLISYSKEHPLLALEDLCLEFSTYGKGDSRESCIELTHADGSVSSDFLFSSFKLLNKKQALNSLPSAYLQETKDTMVSLEIELIDSRNKIKVILTYSVFEESNVITRCTKVINNSKEPVRLRRLMSNQLDLNAHDYTITSFHGSWAREMDQYKTTTSQGIFINDSKVGVSSNRTNPFFIVSKQETTEDFGVCYGFNLVYSGNHYAAVQENINGKLRIIQGINPFNFCFILNEGDEFQSPEAVMTFSHAGFSALSLNMHHFVREHIVRGPWKNKERPVLLNSWEANYFNFDESKLVSQAKAAKEAGIELFVLDDGWFGKRNDDTSSLGDWTENKKKLQNGLHGLSKKINEIGLQFGLWVEPEMVNEDSELYQEHPDWAVIIPNTNPSLGRNQFILDLSQEAVCTYVIKEMSRVFSSANISYVKWDMNRIFTDYYSPALAPEKQSEFSHRYILGLYKILDTLSTSFPQILFESCASGGNRFDLGMLCYMSQTWASDNTDALCRTAIQTGYSYGYPSSVFGAHVSASPNHQTLRVTSFDTRFEVACFGLLGYECNLAELSTEDKTLIKDQIAFYKKYRKVFQFGNFYRIKTNDSGIYQWMIVSHDKKTALGLFVQKEVKANNPNAILYAKGLDPDRLYTMTNRVRSFNIKEFGDLINQISPIHIKQNSVLHNMVALFKKLPGEVESYTATGDLFMYGGIKLKQAFCGLGYNEEVRLFQDNSSRLYLWEAIED